MKKIVRQQNYLKELIETQANRLLSRQALKCLVRSALEPLLDNPESAVVFHRIENKDGLQGLIKRLEFSEIESISYDDNSGNLLEKVWANTEFLCTLTHRYVSILIWDTNTQEKGYVRYYSLYNSKLQKEALDIIKRNSKVDISPYQEKYNPDRRDNELLNSSIRKLLDNLDEACGDAVLGYAESKAETQSEDDRFEEKARVIAHEIRNQLSICDLYVEVINKNLDKDIDKDSLKNSLKSINRALKIAGNSLISLKSGNSLHIEDIELQNLIDTASELCKIYTEDKDIEFQVENNISAKFIADSEKLTAVIINLVKNAYEAFIDDEINGNSPKNGKYIKISTDKTDETIYIMVSNNASGIKNPERIFNEGFTTKNSGSGLGLWICKNSIEAQGGTLKLTRYSEDYTEFTIEFNLV